MRVQEGIDTLALRENGDGPSPPAPPPPDAIVCMAGTEGCGAANGCFLIAQLEAAFVESKFYLFKMAPRLSPEMRGMLGIKTEERKQKKKE